MILVHSIDIFTRTFNLYISHQVNLLENYFTSATSFAHSNNNERRSNENLWIINIPNKGFKDEAELIFKHLPLRYDSLVFEFIGVRKGKRNLYELLRLIWNITVYKSRQWTVLWFHILLTENGTQTINIHEVYKIKSELTDILTTNYAEWDPISRITINQQDMWNRRSNFQGSNIRYN